MPSPDQRDPGIGFDPPPPSGNTNLKEPGMFCSNDGTVINWLGENYYKACGRVVRHLPRGGTSTCVKRTGHPGKIHEDFEGLAFEEKQFDFSALALEQAVHQAIGAGSVCWEDMSGTGVFQEDRAREIAEALMHRIRQEPLVKTCELCAQPHSNHIIRTEDVLFDGQKVIKAVGWNCPPIEQTKRHG